MKKLKSRGLLGDPLKYKNEYFNLIFDALELIGVHLDYQKNLLAHKDTFLVYRNRLLLSPKYNKFDFKDEGEKYIVGLLKLNPNSNRFYSRKKLSKFSHSRAWSVIYFYEDMLVFFNKIFEYIVNDHILLKLFCDNITCNVTNTARNTNEILKFQATFLSEYKSSSSKKMEFAESSINYFMNSEYTRIIIENSVNI